MALTDIDSTITTSMQDATTDYIAGEEPWNKNLDGFNIAGKETDTNNYTSDWTRWHGMYREIPEMRSTIDIWCRWIIGEKIKTDERTEKIISRIKGNGKETFRKILINLKRTSKVCGDSFAEIIKDKAGRLINLKVLDSGTIRIVSNTKGIIIKYEQVAVKEGVTTILNDWKAEKIFHLLNDKIADEIHGIPEPEKLIKIIKWKHQSMSDLSIVFHRYVKPLLQINADTDDATELASLKTKYDNAVKNMENLIIPKGSIASVDRISVPQFSTLDPLPWIILLRDYFVLSSGVPDIILGHSRETSLAAGKLNYLAFKEKIIHEQRDYEEDILSQLNLKLEFEKPREIDIEMDNKAGTNLRTTKTINKEKQNEK